MGYIATILPQVTQPPEGLSIPFMGYASWNMRIWLLLNLTFNSLYGILFLSFSYLFVLAFFQFPLWDTAFFLMFLVLLLCAFNSLYGILESFGEYLAKIIVGLSIPFMGYLFFGLIGNRISR